MGRTPQRDLTSTPERRCALVTGGFGFIGSHLVDGLLEAGWDVVVWDDLSTGRAANLAHALPRSIYVEQRDVRDLERLSRSMHRVDTVFHLAAIPSVPRSLRDPIRSHAANVDGTLAVLEAARRARVRRVVYAASSSAYGGRLNPAGKQDEDLPTYPRSPYAAQKLLGETYCRLWAESFGVETVSLRYFNVFGPRQDPASEYAAVVPSFVKAAIAGMPPVIYGDGEQTRDFTYVADVVAANLLAADAPASGSVFNVSGGQRTSLNDLWDEVKFAVDAAGIVPTFRDRAAGLRAEYAEARPGDVRDSRACLKRAKMGLGYQPRTTLKVGLAAVAKALAVELRATPAPAEDRAGRRAAVQSPAPRTLH